MKKLLVGLLSLALLIAPVVSVAPALAASPSMPSVSTPVYPIAFHLSTQYSASKTGVISFRAPFGLRVLYTTVVVQAKGGTQGTSTLTCNNGASAFTDAMVLSGTAGAIVEATLVSAQQSIAKDTTVTCDLVISGGSSPTLDNITVVIWAQRRN